MPPASDPWKLYVGAHDQPIAEMTLIYSFEPSLFEDIEEDLDLILVTHGWVRSRKWTDCIEWYEAPIEPA
jgi:hypothetical protein